MYSVLALDVKNAVSKEDLLVQLSRVQDLTTPSGYDQFHARIRSGDINGLVRSLHHLLLVYPLHRNKCYYSRLDSTRKLQVMVLCSVIERLLHCSPNGATTTIECNNDFAASLPRVLELFARGAGYSTIRLVTIGNCIRIMLCLSNPYPQTADRFIESLLVLFDCGSLTVPSDILIDASQAIARFVTKSKKLSVLASLEEKISTMISILGTALSSDDCRQCDEALESLWQFAQISSFAAHMANRRVLVYAAGQHLSSRFSRVRKKAVALVGMLIVNYDVQRGKKLRRESNLELIVNALTRSVLKEAKPKLQKSMLSAMIELLNKKGLDLKIVFHTMSSLLDLAMSVKVTEDVAMEAAVAYLQSAGKFVHSEEVLSNVVDFTTSPFAKVRKLALRMLRDITFWGPNVPQVLLRKTVMLECFAMLLAQGSDKDSLVVLSICKQLLFEKCNEQFFLQSDNMVLSLVRLVTQNLITNRSVYIAAVDLVLGLLDNDDNLPYFLQYIDILPWLIKTSNRTTEESMKERLVPIIIRFSAALLHKNDV